MLRLTPKARLLRIKRVDPVVCPLQGIVLREKSDDFGDLLRRAAADVHHGVKAGIDSWRRPRGVFLCPINGFVLRPRESWFRNLVKRYEILDQRAPFLTKCGMGAVCAFAGEFVVQMDDIANVAASYSTESEVASGVESTVHQDPFHRWLAMLNYRRLVGMPAVNVVWVGGILQLWVRAMEAARQSILVKTVLSSVFLNPLYVAVFLAGTTFLQLDSERRGGCSCLVENKYPRDGTDEFDDPAADIADLPFQDAYLRKLSGKEGCALFWAGFWSTPAIFLCKYCFLPERLHLPYLCFVNFLWSIFASKMTTAGG